MTMFASVQTASVRILDRACLAALVLLLANMYLLRWRVLSDVVVTVVVLAALLVLVAGAAKRALLADLALSLSLAALLLFAGAALAADVALAEALTALHRLLLIGAFLIFGGALLERVRATHVLALVFAAGALGAALSVALHLATAPMLSGRLEMLGRPWNPIPAAGAAAAAGLAGLALMRAAGAPVALRVALGAGLIPILAALALTQSRGPAIGFIAAASVIMLKASRATVLGALLSPICFLGASSLVLIEAPLVRILCQDQRFLCRPSMRLPLWERAVDLIVAHPVWGLGVGHRMGDDPFNNPQNALLATAVYFGLPFLAAVLFAYARLLHRLARLEPRAPQVWAAGMMVFSAVYYAFEPSPFAFYNAHWLFLWLPVAVILGSAERGAASADRSDPAALLRSARDRGQFAGESGGLSG